MLNKGNTKTQGNVGLGRCIAFATALGYVVSLPLNDAQAYDLIVDNGDKLLRVQVKTSRCLAESGGYRVDLKSSSVYTYKHFDTKLCDYLFVVTDDGSEYWIPSEKITVKTQITVGADKYSEYRV